MTLSGSYWRPGATFHHLVRLAAESVRNHPPIFVALAPELKISIQSEESRFSSRSPSLLLARNSLMLTVSTTQTHVAAIASTRNRRKTFFRLWDGLNSSKPLRTQETFQERFAFVCVV